MNDRRINAALVGVALVCLAAICGLAVVAPVSLAGALLGSLCGVAGMLLLVRAVAAAARAEALARDAVQAKIEEAQLAWERDTVDAQIEKSALRPVAKGARLAWDGDQPRVVRGGGA
ncbi:MAG: hypothetical protein J0L92_29320 [Deltaproteobacteria bacterium]|nr:hypothetical protein [Deltaproteobacteria bacterium]